VGKLLPEIERFLWSIDS
jgi:hypothetical protein